MMYHNILAVLLFSFGLATNVSAVEVNMRCDRADDADEADCSKEIVSGTGITAEHQILDAFHNCVMEATGENKQFERPPPPATGARDLRLGSPVRRELYNCNDPCVNCEICCFLGFCGSSGCCECSCNSRRLDSDEESSEEAMGLFDVLGAASLDTQKKEVEKRCTKEVKILAKELMGVGNKCLGSPNQMKCHASVFAHTI